ncbi:Dipeptidyl aminopeptidase BI (plasmid) [Asticcacaulis sp. MM231]|uniref:S9 family peptidase n=1 Tax=Asticcacaulis sp. MM231 TaxID=3157666 RepID=UPI0032D56AFF
MNRRGFLVTAAATAFMPAFGSNPVLAKTVLRPPETAMIPKRIEQLGRTRIDNYAWLRDSNWAEVFIDTSKMQPDIRQHLDDENRYADAILAPTKDRQAQYVASMNAMVGNDSETPPSPDGDWNYYTYIRPGEDHTIHARKPRGGGDEQILLDEQARAKGRDYYRVEDAQHSPDHNLFVWAEDLGGGDRFDIGVHDLKTGKVSVTTTTDTYGWLGVIVSPCSKWVFRIQRDQYGRPAKVMRMPAHGGPEALVYEEHDGALFVSLGRTASNSHVTIRISGPDLDEWHLIPAAAPESKPVLIEPRTVGLHYQVETWNNQLIILTDADSAVDGRLVRADVSRPGKTDWQDWVPYAEGCNLLEMHPFRDHFVLLQRAGGKLEVVVTQADGRTKTIAFDEAAYDVRVADNQEFASQTLRLSYQSPRTPERWIAYDMATSQQTVIMSSSVPGHDPQAYEVRALFAAAPDGQQVPLTVLMKKGTKLDGTAPLLLYGYGAYGVPSEADFSIANIALVNAGWIYAIAHVRGGSEKGRSWFLDGRKFKKRNSFTDFNACAEYLIAQGYTAKKRLVAYGLSAGGLLVGASLNLRPDLYAGVIAQVPFVDMLNTMSDATHPLVPAFRPDWGDPLADGQAYDYIASISPYENVHKAAYPMVLATAGVRDNRVSYWEPGKWVAALRAHTTSGKPILFRINMSGGHQSNSGLSDAFAQAALFWSFAELSLKS